MGDKKSSTKRERVFGQPSHERERVLGQPSHERVLNRELIKGAFEAQTPINNTLDFSQAVNALISLNIRGSTTYLEKLFWEGDINGLGRINFDCFCGLVHKAAQAQADDDNESDEEAVAQINSDKAKAFDKAKSMAQTYGSVTLTLADFDKIMNEITGKQ